MLPFNPATKLFAETHVCTYVTYLTKRARAREFVRIRRISRNEYDAYERQVKQDEMKPDDRQCRCIIDVSDVQRGRYFYYYHCLLYNPCLSGLGWLPVYLYPFL